MSRDMKPRQQSQPKRKGGIFFGIVIGLVVGALVAAGFAWYISRTPIPFQSKADAGKSEAKQDGKTDQKAVGKLGDGKAPQPIALPGKPGDKVDDKPRFEFYKILQGKEGTEEAKPGEKPADKPADKAAEKPAAPKPASEPMYLQAGAFAKPEDADNLKARLALMGLEASVQSVATPDKGTLHRVRLGPYARPEDASSARGQLATAGIKADMVKAKD